MPLPMQLEERQSAASYQLYKGRSIRFSQAPELGGGEVRSRAKSTGKGTVIVKPAIVGDVRDRSISFDKQPRSGGQPSLHDELVGGNAENPFDQAGETNRRQPGALGQRTRGNRVVAVCFKVFQSAGETGGDALAVTRSP